MTKPDDIPRSVKAQFDLTGRVAIITGGAGFLGVRFAETIAELGGTAVLFDNNRNGLTAAAKQVESFVPGTICLAETVDVANADQIAAAVRRVKERFGRIDILVNSAALTKSAMEGESGVLGQSLANDFFRPFLESRRDIWDQGIAVNLTATMLMCQAVGAVMVEQGSGSIVNIASDISVVSPDHRIYEPDAHGYPGVEFNSPVFYSVSKAGVVQLTRYLAAYWGTKGVRVNAVSPAGVSRGHDPAFVQKFSTILPIARMARDVELKGAIAFLASDASSFVTGINLMVDGGHTCW